MTALPSPRTCLHCASALTPADTDGFCCRGCAEVHRLLREGGLTRYYDLGGGEGHPVAQTSADHTWLVPIAERVAGERGLTRVALDVQGVHCAACVWLHEKLFARLPGAARIVVNPAVGTVELVVEPSFPLARFVEDVEAFGYRLGPPLKGERRQDGDLVWRMGVCIAIAMNTMIFGFAVYCGLEEGRVFRLFHGLDFALSFLSVLVGGTVFFRSAWQAIRRRVLHLDLPIALGIALVFASSTYTYALRGGATSYFDTLNVFIALMLVGRFLQERVLAKNRAMLLASDGAEGLYTRRLGADGTVSVLRCTELRAGDVLLVGRGDVVPVDAVLLDREAASFSLDWISGESAPREFASGETIPAGAFSHGERALRLVAKTDFDASELVRLLQAPRGRDADASRATSWHKRLTAVYVASVLTIALLTLAGWLLVTHDLARTLDAVAAVLIVTCPCAFGIATPLAYELAQGRLRRAGLFVRTPGFLDRAVEVTRIVFDKTGTLTTGKLAVREMPALGEGDRARLYALVARSSHPKSRAIAAAMESTGAPPLLEADVREITGKGLELTDGDHVYRAGASAWALAPASVPSLRTADVLFTRDGEVLASFELVEELRSDARAEALALQAEGYEAFVVSGDQADATKALARTCGIDEAHAYGGRSPEGKAAWLREHGDAKTLFVGDGINDSLVAEAAYCAGTPAIDRPFMASRCDFYFVTAGIRPIRTALATAKALARVVRTNLVVALLYNAVTVSLAVAGMMSPLLCAVLMPISSLSTVLATTAGLSHVGKDTSWKS